MARDTLYQRFIVHNYAAENVPLLLSLTFGATLPMCSRFAE